MVASAKKAEKDHERKNQLQKEIQELISILQGSKTDTGVIVFDRSDCGQAKQRRLTLSQRSYSQGLNEHFSMKLLDRIAASYSTISEEEPELECDCGQPGVKFYGKHTCRYFGKFECNCGNAWTSAYYWKGETQSCKICNKENLSTVTEHLKRGQNNRLCNNTIGTHDSVKCVVCRRLGHRCSERL